MGKCEFGSSKWRWRSGVNIAQKGGEKDKEKEENREGKGEEIEGKKKGSSFPPPFPPKLTSNHHSHFYLLA